MAVRNELPSLVGEQDIRGDLHVHSEWSDGRDSLEAMLEATALLGHEYVAITDHSAGRGIANGLSIERLRAQISHLRAPGWQIQWDEGVVRLRGRHPG